VVCFAGIVRTYYMWKVTDGYHDVTWDAYAVWLGSAVELYVGIVSMVPILKLQLLTKFSCVLLLRLQSRSL
jgi:hypothetical protein